MVRRRSDALLRFQPVCGGGFRRARHRQGRVGHAGVPSVALHAPNKLAGPMAGISWPAPWLQVPLAAPLQRPESMGAAECHRLAAAGLGLDPGAVEVWTPSPAPLLPWTPATLVQQQSGGSTCAGALVRRPLCTPWPSWGCARPHHFNTCAPTAVYSVSGAFGEAVDHARPGERG